MDLGISGRKAIVCASSRGLGKACAISLARNGVHVTLNGRDESVLATTAQEIRNLAPDIDVITVAGNVSDPQCQQALLDATPGADILINNNGGPPFRDFRELDRKAITEGVIMNMITPIEMINSVIDSMADDVVRALRNNGLRVHHREGTGAGGWVLLDFPGIVVHFFSRSAREFYGLEQLWARAPEIVRVQ
mgnify:CR=1 FL=1